MPLRACLALMSKRCSMQYCIELEIAIELHKPDTVIPSRSSISRSFPALSCAVCASVACRRCPEQFEATKSNYPPELFPLTFVPVSPHALTLSDAHDLLLLEMGAPVRPSMSSPRLRSKMLLGYVLDVTAAHGDWNMQGHLINALHPH